MPGFDRPHPSEASSRDHDRAEPAPDPEAPTPPAAPPVAPPVATPAASPVWSAPSPPQGSDPSPVQSSAAYSPALLPTSEWARGADDGSRGGSPEAWLEPVAASGAPTRDVRAPARNRGAAATIVTASLLSAILASGGTLLALDAAGVLDRPAPATASVQQVGVPAGGIDQSSAIVAAAAKVGPAVVQITSVAGIDPNAVTSLPDTGVGSGVIFDANGWILTNRHVVSGSDKITVALKDGRTFTGTIYGIDTLTDLAIVHVDAKGLPTAAMGDSSSLLVGSWPSRSGARSGRSRTR